MPEEETTPCRPVLETGQGSRERDKMDRDSGIFLFFFFEASIGARSRDRLVGEKKKKVFFSFFFFFLEIL